MNLDPRKSEHNLASYSPVKHNQSQALKDEVEEFLAQGGQIRQISNQTHGDFVSPCFNKSKESLAATARKAKRRLFLFHCHQHGISQHRVKDLACVRCIKANAKGEVA